MPTRKITRSPVKVTGTVPAGQQFESFLEEEFFVLLRFNPLVESFEQQPVKVEWLDDSGKIRRYTPDVLVHYRKDIPESEAWPSMLCEVKPDFGEQAQSPRRHKPPRKENHADNERKWSAASALASRRGWEFKVVRESEIRTPYLANARFLLRYLERGKESIYDQTLLELLVKHGTLKLGEWVGLLSKTQEERAVILPACYRLIAKRVVAVDLAVSLTLESIVTVVGNE